MGVCECLCVCGFVWVCGCGCGCGAVKTNRRGRLSTVDLFIKEACFVKKLNNNCNIKGADIN